MVCCFVATGNLYELAAHMRLSRANSGKFAQKAIRIRPGRRITWVAWLLEGKAVVQIVDVLSDPEYTIAKRQSCGRIGGRTSWRCPLLREEMPVGGCYRFIRTEVRPFTDKQIELVRTLPTRRSSPSRIRGCSTNCANRSSSRPPPPTCSRSSAARPSICRPCCKRSLNQLPGSARPTRPPLLVNKKMDRSIASQAYGFSPEFMDYVRNIPVKPERGTATRARIA